ncbi:MAG: glycosyltransferase family 9 protein [Clostridia bacterium]|nr:glycosyltransferase family 9 protein [Deltaproteobacteria bacterium]
MSPLKRLELLGRRFLTWSTASLLGAPRRKVDLSEQPRILVVRLDERVGNLVLLTPLLTTLTERFPGAVVEVLGYAKTRALLEHHPAVSAVHAFDKRSLFSSHGPLGIFGFLRARAFDLVIDASNPTDPSFTQALITRFAGARYSVGPAQGAFERLYTSPVAISNEGHEIDLRLQLARDLPGGPTLTHAPTLGSQGEPSSTVRQFVKALPTFVVLNLGARIKEKWLAPETYAELAEAVMKRGFACVLTWGPVEKALATQTLQRTPGAKLAPPTNLADLAYVLRNAKAVVTCDTGPMHIAVAVGTPTCAIFVSTDPARYGYDSPPHRAVESRDPAWRVRVFAWLETL